MHKNEEMSLAEMVERSGVPARTVRLYIAQGLLPGPLRSGRNAAYGIEHLNILDHIRQFQREGLTLTQIRHALAGKSEKADLPAALPWRQYVLAPDVHVWVREDIAPWRAKVIRDGIAQLNERLDNATKKENDNGR